MNWSSWTTRQIIKTSAWPTNLRRGKTTLKMKSTDFLHQTKNMISTLTDWRFDWSTYWTSTFDLLNFSSNVSCWQNWFDHSDHQTQIESASNFDQTMNFTSSNFRQTLDNNFHQVTGSVFLFVQVLFKVHRSSSLDFDWSEHCLLIIDRSGFSFSRVKLFPL